MTVVFCRVSAPAPAPVSGNITLQITVSVTRDTSYTRDPRDTRDSLHSDEGVRLVAVRVGGGEAAAAEDADLEGAVLGVEGEAELHLAAVVRHDEAVLAILPTLSFLAHVTTHHLYSFAVQSLVFIFHQRGKSLIFTLKAGLCRQT